MNNFKILRQTSFFDHKTRWTKCWWNLTLKWYAYTFVKAQVEEDCQRNIVYLKRYSYPKLFCNKMNNNRKPTANTVSSTKRTTMCWMRGEIKKLLFIKVTVYLPSIKKQSIASSEISRQFLAPKVPVFRKIKLPCLVRLAIHFSAAMKNLVLGNLFKLFRLAVILAWNVCDTFQLIWIVKMMRLKGGKRRCWQVSIVSVADLRSCHLKPYSYCDELGILRDRGAWTEQNYLMMQHMGHPMVFPKKITSSNCFLPVSTTVAECRSLKMC